MITFGKYLTGLTKNSNMQRGYAIPYTICDDRVFVMLGVDRKTGDFAPLGGGLKSKETALGGILREVKEESNNIIQIDANSVPLNIVLIAFGKACLFYKLDPMIFFSIQEKFRSKKPGRGKYNEMIDILYFTEDVFLELLYKDGMWKEMQKFYNLFKMRDVFQILRSYPSVII